MKPLHVIYAFAVISIAALALQLVSSYWLPLALGAGVAVAIVYVARR